MIPNINDIPFLGFAAILASVATVITAIYTGRNLERTGRAALMAAERLAHSEKRAEVAEAKAP